MKSRGSIPGPLGAGRARPVERRRIHRRHRPLRNHPNEIERRRRQCEQSETKNGSPTSADIRTVLRGGPRTRAHLRSYREIRLARFQPSGGTERIPRSGWRKPIRRRVYLFATEFFIHRGSCYAPRRRNKAERQPISGAPRAPAAHACAVGWRAPAAAPRHDGR